MLGWRLNASLVDRTSGVALSSVGTTLVSRSLSSFLSKLLPVSLPQITQDISVAFTWTGMDEFLDLIITLIVRLRLELFDPFEWSFNGYFR